jgi:hypothetical protein
MRDCASLLLGISMHIHHHTFQHHPVQRIERRFPKLDLSLMAAAICNWRFLERSKIYEFLRKCASTARLQHGTSDFQTPTPYDTKKREAHPPPDHPTTTMALRMIYDKAMGFAANQYRSVLGNQLAQYGEFLLSLHS